MLISRAIISFLILLSSLAGYAQKTEPILISETFDGIRLNKVFKILKRTYKIKFAYDHQLAEKIVITKKIENLTLQAALDEILVSTGLGYKFLDHTIMIVPSDDTSLTKRVVHQTTNKIKQNISVSGVVMDRYSGETLPFATIKVPGTNYGTTSNVDGFFTLLDLESDTLVLQITYLGYYHKKIKLNKETINNLLVVKMNNRPEVLDELVITDKGSEMINSDENISQISLNPTKLLNLPSLGEVDIFRTLQYLPGISGTDETSAGLIIRGSTPDQNLVLFDGFSVFHIDHFFGVFSAFNPYAIKNIQVFKGAFEPRYGGRASSVINITGKTGNLKKPTLNLGANLISATASAELPIGDKLSLFFAMRRSHTDAIQTGLYREIFNKVIFNNKKDFINQLKGFEEIEPQFNFYDLNGKITYKPTDKDIISISTYGGRDKLNINANQSIVEEDFPVQLSDQEIKVLLQGNFKIEDITRWGNFGVSTRWGRQWNKKFYSNWNVAYSNYYSSQDNSERLSLRIRELELDTLSVTGWIQKNNLTDISIKFDNELKIGKNTELVFGGVATINEISFALTLDEKEIENTARKGEQAAFYIQSNLRPFKNLTLNLGLRNNYYNFTGSHYLEPRVSLSYQLTKQMKLKAAWGRHNQFIFRVFNDEIYNNNPAFWVMADGEKIPNVSAEHFVAGLSYELKGFYFDLEAYHKDINDILEFIPNVSVEEETGKEVFDIYLNGNGVSKGIDFLVQKKTGKHTGWVSYSLSKVLNSFPDLNNGRRFPSKQDQRHELKLVNMFSLGKWNISSTWVYGSGKPYSDPRDGTPLAVLDSLNTPYIAASSINGKRLQDYHRLDMAAAYNFNIGKGNAQLGLSIYNIYGRRNVKYKRFSKIQFENKNDDSIALTDDEKSQYLSSDVLLLGFTPNIFFNIKF